MEVKILKEATETIVVIEGRVDTVTAPELQNLVSPFWNESGITLVFDCAALEYVSSSGLRVILSSHKMVVAKGGKFILRNMNKDVRQVIDLTGFSRILTIE
ncbi:MAG: STAS domain-containing protein [Bacteroidaceae bacterium]|nr:STAS domain-containing protein [Bacteroidaceae bacterium]